MNKLHGIINNDKRDYPINENEYDIEPVNEDTKNAGLVNDRQFIINNDEFETEKIINKIKNVKKNSKKNKNPNKNLKNKNYKNIELFDNIYDKVLYEDNEEKQNENQPEEENTKTNNGGKIIEGLESKDGVFHFHSDEWDGYGDGINDDAGNHKMEDPRNILINFINYIYDFITYFEYILSYEITKLLSGNEFHDEDVDVLKKYITWFLSIVFSCFFVYNWYYITFYRNSINQKIQIPEFSRKKLSEYAQSNYILNVLEDYVKFSVFFPEYFQKIFIVQIPDLINDILNPCFSFILLFYFIIYFLYNYSSIMRQFFIDIINVNTNNWLVDIFYLFTFVLFLLDFVSIDITTFIKPKKMISLIESKIPFVQITYYIKILIYFLIVMMISPFLAGMMIFLLFICISFFAILIFSNNDGFFNVISYINEYTETIKKKIRKETDCEPLTFFEKIINYINIAFEFIYQYVFQSAFVFMILWSFYDYTHNILSETLKYCLISINIAIVSFIGIMAFLNFDYGDDE